MNRTIALVVLFSLGLPAMSGAQVRQSVQGMVTAKHYGAVERGRTVSVEIRNYQELSNELVGAITQTLKQQGFKVAENSSLVLFIDTSATAAGAIRPAIRGRESGARLPEGSRDKTGQVPTVTSGVGYDTRVDQPVNVPIIHADRPAGSGLRYRVTATLSERGKTPLWTGSATAVVSGGDRRSIFAALGRELTDSVGETVEARQIEINEGGGIIR